MASEAGLWFQQKHLRHTTNGMKPNNPGNRSEVAIPVENIVGNARFIS